MREYLMLQVLQVPDDDIARVTIVRQGVIDHSVGGNLTSPRTIMACDVDRPMFWEQNPDFPYDDPYQRKRP